LEFLNVKKIEPCLNLDSFDVCDYHEVALDEKSYKSLHHKKSQFRQLKTANSLI
jgi:hypothetical protein